MVNANTGKFDPRHLYGTSNQDVFRWPAIKNGTQKEVLGLYIVSLLMPGIPLLIWGEEQNFYVLENTDSNYRKFCAETQPSFPLLSAFQSLVVLPCPLPRRGSFTGVIKLDHPSTTTSRLTAPYPAVWTITSVWITGIPPIRFVGL
jgi:glycosidase